MVLKLNKIKAKYDCFNDRNLTYWGGGGGGV